MPRKLPFSAKRKKQQLRDRRERKRGDGPAGPASGPGSRSGSGERGGDGPPGEPPPENAGPPRRHDPGRFRLQLGAPRAEALERRRRRAQEEPLQALPESDLEMDPESVYGPGTDFPRRPPWSFGMSPEELRAREEETFGAFLRGLGDGGDGPGDGAGLAPFEHNLETWRQLWRVLEMSDIVLLIVDARHPALGVPVSLATHVTQDLGKGLILILNKIDLVPPALATAWSHRLRARFSPARVVPFSTAPGPPPGTGVWSHRLRARFSPARVVPFSTAPGPPPGTGLQKKPPRRRGGRWSRALGPRLLLEACQEIVGDAVDLSSWRARLERAEQRQEEEEEEEEPEEEEEEEEPEEAAPAGDEDEEGLEGAGPPRAWERYRHGVLTLGCVGLPNAGKSSVLNALLGRSAVGVSRAPGRTRYFQTHFLTGSVRLCDCPGLVFPSRAPPELQVLAGVYPIAQLQDPYSAVGFLGSRLALPPLLQLRPPSGAAWTAWELCEAWAEQRGYRTARAARPDTARAATALLRLAAEGRLRLCTAPPGYFQEKELWEQHPDTAALAAMTGGVASPPAPPGAASSSEDEEGEEPAQATPPPSPAHNPFALLGEDEC